MKRADQQSYKITPGLRQHMERTGEQPPARWFHQPANMETHGGYGVRKMGKVIAGPFAWPENARREADRLGGVMCRYRTAKVVRSTSQERRAEREAAEGPSTPVEIPNFLRRKLRDVREPQPKHQEAVAKLRGHPLAMSASAVARVLMRSR